MTIKVSSPNTGREGWEQGSQQDIRWTSTTDGTVRIVIYAVTRLVVSLADVPARQGAYQWDIPDDFPVGSNYKVQIVLLDSDKPVTDKSDKVFSITRKRAAPPPVPVPPPPSATAVSALPPGLPVDYGFYKKYLMTGCGPILGSAAVSDQAFIQAKSKVEYWLTGRPDLQNMLRAFGHRFLVIGKNENFTTLPEYRNWNVTSPLPNPGGWDERARGVHANGCTSFGEENVLDLPTDRYRGEDILLHEFAHAIHLMAANVVIPNFDARLRGIFVAALSVGLWKGSYSASNHREYWAEGVQSWFNENINTVNTRAALYNYDRNLFNLLDEVFTI